VTESGVFGGADAVLDPGVGSVPGVEVGELPDGVSVANAVQRQPSRSSNASS
jgi:hypothetical protein